MKPSRVCASWRHRRVPIPEATYFITLCTGSHDSGLNLPPVAGSIKAQIAALEADRAIRVQAVVIMPGHLHLLFVATGQLSVEQLVGRLKSKTKEALLTAGVSWRGDFYEHRVRTSECIEDVLHFLFLNPYRSKLISPADRYPWFWLGQSEAAWFHRIPINARPIPAWLA